MAEDEIHDGVGGSDVGSKEGSMWCEEGGLRERLGLVEYVVFGDLDVRWLWNAILCRCT